MLEGPQQNELEIRVMTRCVSTLLVAFILLSGTPGAGAQTGEVGGSQIRMFDAWA